MGEDLVVLGRLKGECCVTVMSSSDLACFPPEELDNALLSLIILKGKTSVIVLNRVSEKRVGETFDCVGKGGGSRKLEHGILRFRGLRKC